MAYNVKYRLEFSDVKGNGRKVEILKDGYIGSVLPMIGTAEPVVIDWKSKDDFYEYIIGSTCTLNLMVTDTVSYDDFYLFDEREYKIRVSYKDDLDAYQTYWEGFVVVDAFKEAINTTPYTISLKATDGLGTLKAFDAPGSNTGSQGTTDSAFHYLRSILNQTFLGFDIYIANLIRKDGGATNDTIFHDILINEFGAMKPNLTYRNSKELLEAILKATNSKVYQSGGKWYVVSNTNLPTQNVTYKYFSSAGTFLGTSVADIRTTLPTQMKPIKANLMAEYLYPVRKAIYQIDLDSKAIINTNPHFLYDASEWSIQTPSTGKYAAVVSDSSYGVKALSAGKYFHTNDIDSVGADVQSIAIPKEYNQIKQYKDIEIGFSYYIENADGSDETYSFGVKVVADIDGSLPYEYYNFETEQWEEVAQQSDAPQKNITTSTINSWGNTKFTVKPYTFDGNNNPAGIIVILNRIKQGSGTGVGQYVKHYIDNFYIAEVLDLEGGYEVEKDTTTLARTGVYTSEKNIFSNKLNGSGFAGSIPGLFERPTDASPLHLEVILMQEVINDFRTNRKRYEGTLYKNTSSPVPMFYNNKILVDFGASILQDPVSCYIDSLKYKVKANEYDVVIHLPNQASDQSATTYERYI
jgi:hypothetical protein